MSITHQSYYDVLEVEKTASQADIKRAFRKLAKRYHPDTNPRRPKAAAKRLKEILAAYNVLRNERERARYDVLLQSSPLFGEPEQQPRTSSIADQARGILEDLLRGEGVQALASYDELVGRMGISLNSFMGMRDYLDCVFLVAEQMERVGRNREAARLYEELYDREKEPPRYRHFLPTVKVRLKKLYSRKLPRDARTPEEEIACYERILEFEIDRSEKAFILKKIAEVHLKVGDTNAAKKIFREALDLKPGLKGTATIRERLGFGGARDD
jgi:curved DNA-binding protein CbpA